MITRTISVIELLWTATCLLAFVFMLKPLRRSLNIREAVVHTGINGIREYAAFTSLLLFSSFQIVLFIFITVGVVSMLIEPTGGTVPRASYVLGGLLIVCAFILALIGYVVGRRQDRLEKQIIKTDWRGHA